MNKDFHLLMSRLVGTDIGFEINTSLQVFFNSQ